MYRTPLAPTCLRTASTTSTTGPHVRLEQNFGVAKTTTKGLCAASEPAIEYRSSVLSGGVRVVSSRKLPWVLAIVGVFAGIAREPTAGARGCLRTLIVHSARTGLPLVLPATSR